MTKWKTGIMNKKGYYIFESIILTIQRQWPPLLLQFLREVLWLAN